MTGRLYSHYISRLKSWRRYIDLKKKTEEQVNFRDLAYMEDKIRVHKGENQLYGTQYRIQDGQITFLPIEDEGSCDVRRKKVGLETLKEYKKKAEENL